MIPDPNKPAPDPARPIVLVWRISRGRKRSYVRAARGRKLVAWMGEMLDRASGHRED